MNERLPITVFIVDDETVISSTRAMILSQSGFKATAFFSAEAAIAAAESGCPQLLITDVAMPGMNGIDLAIRFETLCPKCKVLLFAGQASTGDLLAMARNQGHDFAVLAKPVHPRDLLAAIRKLGEPQEASLFADEAKSK
jgi:DNA-binding NtrC family response regulator